MYQTIKERGGKNTQCQKWKATLKNVSTKWYWIIYRTMDVQWHSKHLALFIVIITTIIIIIIQDLELLTCGILRSRSCDPGTPFRKQKQALGSDSSIDWSNMSPAWSSKIIRLLLSLFHSLLLSANSLWAHVHCSRAQLAFGAGPLYLTWELLFRGLLEADIKANSGTYTT